MSRKSKKYKYNVDSFKLCKSTLEIEERLNNYYADPKIDVVNVNIYQVEDEYRGLIIWRELVVE